jgi:hypothetical protein
MTNIMKQYIKRYSLEAEIKDDEVVNLYYFHNGKKLKMEKEDKRWVCKDERFIFAIPNI